MNGEREREKVKGGTQRCKGGGGLEQRNECEKRDLREEMDKAVLCTLSSPTERVGG